MIPVELKGQTLELNGDELISFIGDFNWSLEALSNIVKNCMEHTPDGGKITISYSDTSIFTLIEISDNGEGIHKSDLPYIFNRFYKGKNAGSDSIGIGLALSKSIIEGQGGTVDVRSEIGRGTNFSIKFHKGVV